MNQITDFLNNYENQLIDTSSVCNYNNHSLLEHITAKQQIQI